MRPRCETGIGVDFRLIGDNEEEIIGEKSE